MLLKAKPRITPEDLTPAQRERVQDIIAQRYLSQFERTGGTRKGDVTSIPATQKMIALRRTR